MNKIALAGMLVGAGFVAPVTSAQQFNGAEINYQYSEVGYNNPVPLVAEGYEGRAEFGLSQQFALQADFASLTFGDDDATALTAHGIYHMSPSASVGVFAGQETLGSAEPVNNYGIEFGFGAGNSGYEAYLGRAVDEVSTQTTFGAMVESSLSELFTVSASYDVISGEGFDISRTTTSLVAKFGNGFEASVGLGQIEVTAGILSGDTDFATIGLTRTFGAARGATFESRGIFASQVGF